jgi:hypothetical protein
MLFSETVWKKFAKKTDTEIKKRLSFPNQFFTKNSKKFLDLLKIKK